MSTSYLVRPDAAFGYNRLTGHWEAVDTSTPVTDLFNIYQTMEIGVEALGALYTFDPHKHTSTMKLYTGTLQNWFNANSGVQFPDLVDGLPTLKFASAHWQSLYADTRAKAALVPPGMHSTRDFSLDDATDIVIIVEPEHQTKYLKNVLYAIDGQFVHSVYDPEGVRLKGGGSISRRAAASTVGCLVFNDIGNVKTVPIGDVTLCPMVEELGWYSTLMLGTTESLYDKTVGVVVAGVLYWIPPSSIISEHAVMFSFRNFDMSKTLYELNSYYNWEFLGLNPTDLPNSVSRIISSETLGKLFHHESCFLVVVDNPYLETERVPVDCAGVNGMYFLNDPADRDGKKPLGALINSYGKVVDYWPTFEEGKWSFNTANFENKNLLMNHAKWKKQRMVNDAQPIVEEPWAHRTLEMVHYRARVK